MNINIRRAAVGVTFFAAVMLSGCLADRWVGVEPGEYVVAHRSGTANATALAEIQKLEIDRDKGVAIFSLVGKQDSFVPFTPRGRAEWPSGCPTNINATRMEVLDLEETPLIIGSITLRQPVLVRGCPPDPIHVILREDGPIGGGGGACTDLNRCVFFEPQPASALLNTPLPLQ